MHTQNTIESLNTLVGIRGRILGGNYFSIKISYNINSELNKIDQVDLWGKSRIEAKKQRFDKIKSQKLLPFSDFI